MLDALTDACIHDRMCIRAICVAGRDWTCSKVSMEHMNGFSWTWIEMDACMGDGSDMYMRTLTNLDVSRIIGYASRHGRQRNS